MLKQFPNMQFISSKARSRRIRHAAQAQPRPHPPKNPGSLQVASRPWAAAEQAWVFLQDTERPPLSGATRTTKASVSRHDLTKENQLTRYNPAPTTVPAAPQLCAIRGAGTTLVPPAERAAKAFGENTPRASKLVVLDAPETGVQLPLVIFPSSERQTVSIELQKPVSSERVRRANWMELRRFSRSVGGESNVTRTSSAV